MSPLAASAHACAVCEGQGVDVDVVKRPDEYSSHITIVIHGHGAGAHAQTVDYVTDDANLDAALSTGIEIAQAVIDGEEGAARRPRSAESAFRRRTVRVEAQARVAPGGF